MNGEKESELERITREQEEAKKTEKVKEEKGKRFIVALEGDESKGVVEETEKVLKPEERDPLTILWTFVRYPFWLSIFGFFVTLVTFTILRWDLARIFFGALVCTMIIFVTVSAAVIKWTIEISSDPPFIGAVTLYGRITPYTAPAGYFLTIPYIRDVILIDTRRVDQDFEAQNVVTRDNAIVKVSGHASYQVDPDRISMFIRSGKFEIDANGKLVMRGISLILDNMFLQHQRGEVNKMDLEGDNGVLGSSEKLTAKISEHLTGAENEDEIKAMAKNGKADLKGLGIRMFVINVTNVEPSGPTKKALELAIQEKLQRKAEVYEVVTRGRQATARILIERGIDITEVKPEEIKETLEKIQKEDPVKFGKEFDEFFDTLFELQLVKEKPGVIIPGMRRRLATQGGSVPWDVIGAALAGLLRKPIETPKEKTEKPKKGKNRKEKEDEDKEYEEDKENQ